MKKQKHVGWCTHLWKQSVQKNLNWVELSTLIYASIVLVVCVSERRPAHWSFKPRGRVRVPVGAQMFRHFYIGLWCNGNTEVSEAFVRGSNPCRPTMSYGVMVTHGSLKPTLWVRVPLGLPICGCSVNGLSVPGFQPGGKSSSLFIRTTYGSVAQ